MRTIISKARIFIHKEHGNRLIFINGPSNPRDELGKMGVDTHTSLGSAFRAVVSVKVPVLKGNNESLQTIHFNRLSLVKYLISIPNFIDEFLNQHPTDQLDYQTITKTNPHYNKIDFFRDFVAQNNDKLADSIDLAMNVAQTNIENKKLYQQIYHAGVSHQEINFGTNFRDSLSGKFFSWLYQKTIGSFSSIKTRFLFANTEKDYTDISQSMARLRFNEARNEGSATNYVPAYREFLKAQANLNITRFSDVPATTKKNYITPNQLKYRDSDTHFNGKYPEASKTDTSTGTTGKPTTWVRSHHEVEVVKKSMNVAREVEFRDRRLHFINAFALGPWATGMTVYEMMRKTEKASTFACGPDKEKILDNLENIYQYEKGQIKKAVDAFIASDNIDVSLKKELKGLVNKMIGGLLDDNQAKASNLFDALNSNPRIQGHKKSIVKLVEHLNKHKKQYVLSGYPPFLKAIADEVNANDKEGFQKYHVRGVVGGQGISESFRDSLVNAGFSKVNSSYGASDLDINVAAETEFEIKLRRTLDANPALARDLYGENKSAPMIFHYDPFNYHIEADQDDELYFTCVRNDRSSPRIRYDLGDKGRVYVASDIEALLLKYGIDDLKPKINFPLLFIWGRDSAVSFNGAKAAFDDLEHAVTKIDGKKNEYLKRAFYKYKDKQGGERFDILIELNDKVPMLTEKEAKQLLRQLIVEMAVHNQDFRSHLVRSATTPPLPQLRIFKRNESPISEPGGVRKQVLVFDEHNLPDNYDIDKKSQKTTFSIIKDEKFSSALDAALGVATPSDDKAKEKDKKKDDKELEKLSRSNSGNNLLFFADSSSSSSSVSDAAPKSSVEVAKKAELGDSLSEEKERINFKK